MKRTILMTMMALTLTLGANSVYAGSCSSCRHWGSGSASSAISPWQQVIFVLSAIYIP
jgi:hypothetical protein